VARGFTGDESVPGVWNSEIAQLAASCGNRPAVTDLDGVTTFAELARRAGAMANLLRGAGVEPGRPVVTLIENSAEAIWVSWAIALAGACEVTLNPMQSAGERDWCTALVSPVAIVHDGRSMQLPCSDAPVFDCRGFASQVAEAAGAGDNPGASDAHWGRILFTSGTTGRPKGVVHTHYGRWLAATLLRHGVAKRTGTGSTLLMTPFSHGASLLAYALLLDGRPVHLVPGVQTEAIAPLIREGKVTQVFAPPSVLGRIVELFRGESISTMRTIFTGTAPLAASLYADARRIFGPCMRVTYGMTEIFNPITVLEPEECDACYNELGERAAGMVGWAAPGVVISIRDEAGRALGCAEQGEVYVAARHAFAGYLREDGRFESASAFHRTGDIGRIDERYGLELLGRMHDSIKTGGYKVLPMEVEAALRERGFDGDFVILGLPSEHWGQVIACARAAPDDDWIGAARAAAVPLSRYKQPRLFVTLPTVWRNAIGKVDRNRIRRYILDHFDFIDGRYPVLRAKSARS